MQICSDSALSTLSNEWYQTARSSSIHGHESWTETIEVKITTLDLVAAKYGVPKFVKIDVEGFEDRVLAGMSFQPDVISFEFHFALMDCAHACLNSPGLQTRYQFNYIVGNSYSLKLPQWVGATELRGILESDASNEEYGDIFCRKV